MFRTVRRGKGTLVKRWHDLEVEDQRNVLAAAFPFGFTLGGQGSDERARRRLNRLGLARCTP
jgi:hypothetical protein